MMFRDPYRVDRTAAGVAQPGPSTAVVAGERPSATREDHASPAAESPAVRLRRIADLHYDALWRTLRYMGVPDAGVDDAAQQVLCVLARRLDDIAAGAEKAFLFSTAIRVASDARRAARRNRAEPTERIDAFPAIGPSPEELIDQQRAQRILTQAVDAIAPDLRVVFVLFEIEELTLAEIAALVGIPVGTVASRLRRARESFRAIVTRRQASDRRGTRRGPP
jgi:RNA polymerase sigma-70 factor, ECF subfamily